MRRQEFHAAEAGEAELGKRILDEGGEIYLPATEK
jgi:hypothetical protein